jgi:hypothetical protein
MPSIVDEFPSWPVPGGCRVLGIWRGDCVSAIVKPSRSRARYGLVITGVTFAVVAGVDEAKQELVKIVDFLKHLAACRRVRAERQWWQNQFQAGRITVTGQFMGADALAAA